MDESKAVEPRTSKRSRWKFSLKTLLIVLTLFCVWFGTWAGQSNRQRRAVEAIARNGGEFRYAHQKKAGTTGSNTIFLAQAEPPGPKWLRQCLGDDYFVTPVTLSITNQGEIRDDCLAQIDALPYL